MYQDEKLVCEDCGAEFIFTAGEQEFYAEKGLVNKPKRCPDCRKARRNNNRKKEECMMLFALNAVLKPKFRSNLFQAKKSIAKIALLKNKQLKIKQHYYIKDRPAIY